MEPMENPTMELIAKSKQTVNTPDGTCFGWSDATRPYVEGRTAFRTVFLSDSGLGCKAQGVLCRILSAQPNESATASDIARSCHLTPFKWAKVRDELIDAGYGERIHNGYRFTDDPYTHSTASRTVRANRIVKSDISPAIRWAVWERDDFRCVHCGRRQFLSVDHIHPETRGGTLRLDNLQTLCKPCNSRKGGSMQ